jgi:3-methyladenine DNA glycosylase AlkD
VGSSIQLDELHAEIVNRLEQMVKSETGLEKRLKWFEQQHQVPGLTAYGIPTPKVRKLIHRFMSKYKQLSLEEKFALATQLYESGNFEQATIGDALVELNLPHLTPVHLDLLDEVVGSFNNWASVDWLCLHGLQSLLLQYREETLDLLRTWNRAENLWKRRASALAFVRKVGASGEFTDEVLDLCDNLIWDEEEIVQKGVGWALKDNLPGAKERVLDYVKTLRQKGVPSTITLYAIRDLKGKEREEVLKVKTQ